MKAAPTDAQILQAMACRPAGIFTYVIRNILAGEHGMTSLKTPAVRTRLKRLAREGKVEQASRWSPGCHMEWKLK
ncbi:hypothetical protein BH11PSE6_BH11PSE6_12280 [soil metagenome]